MENDFRKGQSRSRPVRVAFLVQDDENVHLAIDGIFADCYRRWGGRFSLIVPCADDCIPDVYRRWLHDFDPDVVYSYVHLEEQAVLDLHQRLSPSVYIEHEHRSPSRLDAYGFAPRYGISLLSSLSTIFKRSRHRDPRVAGSPLSIIDSWHTDSPTRFMTDNFGTYHTSYSTGMFPADALKTAQLLTIVTPETKADRRFGVPRNLVSVGSQLEAFQAFAEHGALSLAEASMDFSEKLDLRHVPWSDRFNLVVGDTYLDRILFWNARLLLPNWIGSDIGSFRVDLEDLRDEIFFAALVTMVNRRNFVNDGSGGQHALAIRSTSVSKEVLEHVAQRMRATRCYSIINCQFVDDLSAIVPTNDSFNRAGPTRGLNSFLGTGTNWSDFQLELPVTRPITLPPEHLLDAPPRQQFVNGVWATDYLLDQGNPKPKFAERNRWLLPRRWRMAGAFSVNFATIDHAERLPERSSVEGRLTLFESFSHRAQAITVPSAYEAIHYAIWQDGYWRRAEGHRGPVMPKSPVVRMSPSNEARYLNGIIGMAGGLDTAERFLLHPFLQTMFSSMGGMPGLPVDKVQPTITRLRKLQPKVPMFDLTDEHERGALGTLIVKAAQTLKSPLSFLRYRAINEKWAAHRQAYWERTGRKPKGDPDIDWDEREQDSLDESLTVMRGRRMIFQGHQWTCPECHHRNWIDMTELQPRLACGICRHEIDAPIAIDWHFRPNEFLIEALRDHSVLSLMWVLSTIRDEARQSFFYAGPSWFWYDDPDATADAEADLLMVADRSTIVGEVKSSWASLRARDIDDLGNLALRLRPDIALLAVMDIGEAHAAKLQDIRATLMAAGIKFRLMTLTTNPLEDSPHLHS